MGYIYFNLDEEEENNENQDNNVQQEENPANSETYLERIKSMKLKRNSFSNICFKEGVSYYWNSLFVNQNQQAPSGDVLPKVFIIEEN